MLQIPEEMGTDMGQVLPVYILIIIHSQQIIVVVTGMVQIVQEAIKINTDFITTTLPSLQVLQSMV